jgi:hypothetical protein
MSRLVAMAMVAALIVGGCISATTLTPVPTPTATRAPTATAAPTPSPTPMATPSPSPVAWDADLPQSTTTPAEVEVQLGSEILSPWHAGWMNIRYATLINVVPDPAHEQLWLVLRVPGPKVVRNDAWSCYQSGRRCPGATIVYSTYQGVTLWVAVTTSTIVLRGTTILGTGLDLAAEELRSRFQIGDTIPQVVAYSRALVGTLLATDVAMTKAGVSRMDALVGVRLDPAKREISLHCDELYVVDYH